jgi:hypothetical protein
LGLRSAIGRAAVCAFLAAGLFRYVYSSIVRALNPQAWITVPDQLQPLVNLLWHGTPVKESLHLLSEFFRYGPTLYLVSAPIVAATRSHDVIHYALLALAHLFFWLTLYFIDRRLFASSHWTIRVLFVAVGLNFTPILESLYGATLDIWEMLAVVAAFYLYTSSARRGPEWSAVPIAASIMAKLMPLLVLLFLFVRRRMTIVISAVTALLILIAGQLFFGPEMGFGFPARALQAMLIFSKGWAPVWWENDAPRGLVYKALTGFRLPPGVLFVQISPGLRHGVDLAMTVLGLALLAFVVVKLWRWEETGPGDLRVLGGFSTAVVLHHLISPYTTHQYLPSTLLAYAFVLVCALRGLLTRSQAVMAVLSLFLIGNLVPKSLIVFAMGLGWINRHLHSAPHLEGHQMYTFYGFPGIGIVLLGIVVLRLQWKLVQSQA